MMYETILIQCDKCKKIETRGKYILLPKDSGEALSALEDKLLLSEGWVFESGEFGVLKKVLCHKCKEGK